MAIPAAELAALELESLLAGPAAAEYGSIRAGSRAAAAGGFTAGLASLGRNGARIAQPVARGAARAVKWVKDNPIKAQLIAGAAAMVPPAAANSSRQAAPDTHRTSGGVPLAPMGGMPAAQSTTPRRRRPLLPRPGPKSRLIGVETNPGPGRRPPQRRRVRRARPAPIPREISLVRSVASRYLRFLKYPSEAPPRLGSTGAPTLLVHGYLVQQISFATNVGSTPLPPTDMLVYLSPRMYNSADLTIATAVSPVTICLSHDPLSTWQNAVTSSVSFNTFTNDSAIFAQLGTTATARFVGGSVSVDCRCPMSDRAPYLYGGLLPSQRATTPAGATMPVVNTASQLNGLTPTNTRGAAYTTEVSGMTASSVYRPTSSSSLEFTPFISTTATFLIDSAIPFIGMAGCSANTTATILVSAWFEVQANTTNSQFAGFTNGPRISTEDVFEELKPFPTLSNRIVPTGPRTATGMPPMAMAIPTAVTRTREIDSLQDELKMIQSRLNTLSVAPGTMAITTSPSQDFDTIADYSSLSQSTISLARDIQALKSAPKTTRVPIA